MRKLFDEPLAEAKKLHESTGKAARVFSGFSYSTLKSRSRSRRVVAKAKWLDKGENPRFVVTSLQPAQIAVPENRPTALPDQQKPI